MIIYHYKQVRKQFEVQFSDFEKFRVKNFSFFLKLTFLEKLHCIVKKTF